MYRVGVCGGPEKIRSLHDQYSNWLDWCATLPIQLNRASNLHAPCSKNVASGPPEKIRTLQVQYPLSLFLQKSWQQLRIFTQCAFAHCFGSTNEKGRHLSDGLFFVIVDPRRFELPASSVQMKRSTK